MKKLERLIYGTGYKTKPRAYQNSDVACVTVDLSGPNCLGNFIAEMLRVTQEDVTFLLRDGSFHPDEISGMMKPLNDSLRTMQIVPQDGDGVIVYFPDVNFTHSRAEDKNLELDLCKHGEHFSGYGSCSECGSGAI